MLEGIRRNRVRASLLGVLAVACATFVSGTASALAVDCIFSGCPSGPYSIEVSRTSLESQLADLAARAGLPSGFFTTLASGDSTGSSPASPALAVGAVYTLKGELPTFGLVFVDDWNTDPRNGGGWIKPRSYAIPEPTAALVFGVGMLVAGGLIARRARRA